MRSETFLLKSITLQGWRQFGDVDVRFGRKVTVLTGANGSGKTTILRLLATFFGINRPFLGTPEYKGGSLSYRSDVRRSFITEDSDEYVGAVKIGEILFNDETCKILVAPRTGNAYNPQLNFQTPPPGLFISSHRPTYEYQQVTQIPTALNPAENIYGNVASENANRSSPGTTQNSPSFLVKQTLIAWAIFGPGSEIVSPNPEALAHFHGFEEVLRNVLPPEIGFKSIRIEMPEVNLQTESGTFPLESASGGVGALIDLAWQVYLFTLTTSAEFLLLLDEPENHLHPSMQRHLIPSLAEAFPKAQLVITTHSPFVISADPDATVYALTYDADRRVFSQLVDQIRKTGTANDVLRDTLGLPATSPVWVEEKVRAIIASYVAQPITDESLNRLREDLTSVGLEDYVPESIVELVEQNRRSDDEL